MVITVAIYTHPELYPPVLNIVDELSKLFSRIKIISRNLKKNQWKYPDQVQFQVTGQYKAVQDSEHASIVWKVKSFLHFTSGFYKILSQERADWVMCNDPISLFSFRLIRPFLRYKVKLWYHSHDVAELDKMRKYSVGYFAVKSETGYFHSIDLFTLPSESRISYFPIESFKGKWFVVPNYPSLNRMGTKNRRGWDDGSKLKLLYQGRISDEHGLEELIDFIKTDSTLLLTIIGPGNEIYIRSLKFKISESGTNERVTILDPVSYIELQEITFNHHVGIAVNKPMNILYATAALASNKIYEYAAAYLPILYYKDEHYIQFLGKLRWAFPTDLTVPDLSRVVQNIKTDYSDLSKQAKEDFQLSLNFEVVFRPILSFFSDIKISANE